jgi:predicted MPP superfamily phosphohydrolase
MDIIILIILILFYFTQNNQHKSLLLIMCLGYTLYNISNSHVEHFSDKNEFIKLLKECCNKKELDLISKKIDCILNNKNTYKYLLNNANKILPSKKSVIDILFKMF